MYICDKEDTTVSDGQWLLETEGKLSLKKNQSYPCKKLLVTGDDFSFECEVSNIKLIAKVCSIISEV
ncbi:hypothetical protein AB5R26_002223 [Enterobacter mori]